jgi:thiamine biosynthesis protein ThiC
MNTNAPRNRSGRPPYDGDREAAAAADRDRRRDEYVDLRNRLAMSRAALARLLDLSVGTVGLYPARSSLRAAPTNMTLEKMRAELVRRARQTIEEAEMRAEIERELAVHEARWHVEKCGTDAENLEDST